MSVGRVEASSDRQGYILAVAGCADDAEAIANTAMSKIEIDAEEWVD